MILHILNPSNHFTYLLSEVGIIFPYLKVINYLPKMVNFILWWIFVSAIVLMFE